MENSSQQELYITHTFAQFVFQQEVVLRVKTYNDNNQHKLEIPY